MCDVAGASARCMAVLDGAAWLVTGARPVVTAGAWESAAAARDGMGARGRAVSGMGAAGPGGAEAPDRVTGAAAGAAGAAAAGSAARWMEAAVAVTCCAVTGRADAVAGTWAGTPGVVPDGSSARCTALTARSEAVTGAPAGATDVPAVISAVYSLRVDAAGSAAIGMSGAVDGVAALWAGRSIMLDSGATGLTGPVAPATAAGAGEGMDGARAAVVEMRGLTLGAGTATLGPLVLTGAADGGGGAAGTTASIGAAPAWGSAEDIGPGGSTTPVVVAVSGVAGAGVSGVRAAVWAGHGPAAVVDADRSATVVSRSVVTRVFCAIARDDAGWSTAVESCASSTGIASGMYGALPAGSTAGAGPGWTVNVVLSAVGAVAGTGVSGVHAPVAAATCGTARAGL